MQQELIGQKGRNFALGKFPIFGDCQIVKERIIFNYQILVTI